jgi:hypothetical protein
MDAPQQPQAFKCREVSSDRLRGHVELVGKLPDFHAAVATRSAQDLLVAF